MGVADLEILRTFELRLLRCSLSAASVGNNERTPHHYKELEQKQDSLLRLIEDVVNSIESGNYIQALSSDAVRLIFEFSASWDFHDSIDCADRFYSEVEKSVVAFLRRHSVLRPEEEGDWLCRAFLVMCIAVAAFLAFTQANLTGPLDGLPSFPLSFRLSNDNKAVTVGAEWDIWARNHLMSTGSDLLGKFSAIQYIVYAKLLLMKTKDMFVEENISSLDGIRSISWWLARLILIQQRILDERSSSLFDILQVLMGETLEHFGDFGEVTSYWGSRFHEEEASTIVSTAHLEAGVMEYIYGRVDSSRVHFKSAEEASRLQLSVTGVLGFRTVHQEEAKAQMVLIPNMSMSKGGGIIPTINSEVQRDVYGLGENKVAPHPCATSEASDILMTPRLIDNKNFGIDGAGIHQNGNDSVSLEAIQQAVILVQCLLIEKSTPYSEMQRWEMAPYIEAVDAQRFSCFIIQRFCDILRIRWESTRGRTKERAVMMMDKLVQDVYEPPPGVAERIMFCYGVCVPTIPALRKEYGELLVSCGMMGEAIKIFEDLELWDNLIYCYCLLEKKAAAVDLIKLQLSKMPNDPRLWCSLGDVTNDDACYEKALEVSNNRSARAKRSLARSAYNKGDYETSKILWESALTLNSLYPDGWFALGAAALKARDIDKALDAFTRAVQLDPENGEAWNNIACLHMIKKRSKEAFIAFKEALKFRRNSWQLWENYSQVAVDISNFSQALEATKMVLDLTGNKRIDADLLERIMLEMEGRTFTSDTISPVANFGHNCSTEIQIGNFSAGVAGSGETGLVMELLGKVLHQAVRSGGGRDDVWGLYARWHKIKGDLAMCSEALLKQVRSYQGADLWKDGDRFKKFARASLQLCKVYMEISSSTTSNRELTAAEMHLRNTVKQAVIFSDTEEFKELQSCLNEIKLLQANSVPSTECSS